MAGQSNGKLRHFALSVPDPWATAKFYMDTFGMDYLGETDGKLAEGVFLGDGVVNLALLKFKDDYAAQGTGKDFVGLHHLGFWVDHQIEAGDAAVANGAKWIMGDPNNKGGYEVKYTDPNGIIFDIAEDGWGGARKNPGTPGDEACPNPRKVLPQFADRRARAGIKVPEPATA